MMEDWEQMGEHITLHMLCMHEPGYKATGELVTAS